MNKMELESGSYCTISDNVQGAQKIILGSEIASALFPEGGAVGKTITLIYSNNRFGFEDASKFGLKFNDVEGETPFFMVKIFDTDKIEKINGTYKDNECFKVDEEELESFDKNFPPKKKEKRETK